MTKVVVVDDDPANVSLTEMLLQLDGFDVTACTNLTQAIKASTVDVQAYVVDINLARGENGLDLLRQVRQGKTAASPNTAFIITSGDYRRRDESLRVGASHFLLKPYPPDQLAGLINDLIKRSLNG